MRYATLCSGIEACSSAWHPLGFEPVFFSEIEPFPKAVLKHHYPNVPDLGDMTLYQDWKDYGTIDLICAGTPCQAFSVAGLREGLADPRGNLTLVFLGVLAKYRPKWVVWENVPGVLSDKSNAFGQFVAGLSELGYGVAWRVLDAQYFGVAQRRRRVFVVGCLGDWRASASVLLDPYGLSGHPAPSRKAGEGTTGSASFSAGNSGEARGVGYTEEGTPPLRAGASGTNQVPTVIREVSDTVTSKWMKGSGGPSGNETGNMVLSPTPKYFESHPNDSRVTGPHDVGNSVTSRWGTGGGNTPIVAEPMSFDTAQITSKANRTKVEPGLPASTLAKGSAMHVATPMVIRRITPTEAERLQGFSDGYTNIPWRGKPESPDGPRYKALGNSMAVPVMRWIGERIKDVDDYMKARGA
jgi:DNA (cytosine-5)-methyltransferase 1